MSVEDANIGNHTKGQSRVVGRKSWLAYFGALVRYGIIGGMLYFSFINYEEWNREFLSDYPFQLTQNIFFLLSVVLMALFLYQIAVIRSYKVFVNNAGAWLTGGILPWAKFGNGLRWRDADMAFYQPGFISWIANSYTVGVKHKFTNQTDYIVSNVWRGRVTCSLINEILNGKNPRG